MGRAGAIVFKEGADVAIAYLNEHGDAQETRALVAGHPEEVAPSYVFLASDNASYTAGRILHPKGGEVMDG